MINMYMVAKPSKPRPAKRGIPHSAKSVFPTIIASGGEFCYQLVRCRSGGYLSSCWWREEQTPVVETFLTIRTFSRCRTGGRSTGILLEEVFSLMIVSYWSHNNDDKDFEQEHVQTEESGLSDAELPSNKKKTEVPNELSWRWKRQQGYYQGSKS